MTNRSPAFLHKLDVRRHAVFNLTIFFAVLTILIVATFLVPGAKDSGLWLTFLAVLGGGNLVLMLLIFLPSLVRGGTYRVIIQDDSLRVESPSKLFGESFEISLPMILRLVIRKHYDSVDRHEIHSRDGQIIVLDKTYSGKRHLPAPKLFETIRQLHPEIPVEVIKE